eukprot:COSAG01_NODE_18428_length_1077_cov_0.890593_1_plen_64_part_00
MQRGSADSSFLRALRIGVYICGDGGAMFKAVNATLLEILRYASACHLVLLLLLLPPPLPACAR